MEFFQLLKVGGYMKTITRTQYLDRIIELNGTPDIKIITGIRRSGKSTLMQQYQQQLLTQGVRPEQIQVYNFEDLAIEHLLDYRQLHAHISQRLLPDCQNYLFFDEVQMVD